MKVFNNESIFEVIVNSDFNKNGDLKSSVAIRMNDDLADYMEEEEINRLREIAYEMTKMFKNPIKEWAINKVIEKMPKKDTEKVLKDSTKELLEKIDKILNGEDEISREIDDLFKDLK